MHKDPGAEVRNKIDDTQQWRLLARRRITVVLLEAGQPRTEMKLYNSTLAMIPLTRSDRGIVKGSISKQLNDKKQIVFKPLEKTGWCTK